MLYRNPEIKLVSPLGGFAVRIFRSLAPHRGRATERDLASLSLHVQRDLGLVDSGLAELAARK